MSFGRVEAHFAINFTSMYWQGDIPKGVVGLVMVSSVILWFCLRCCLITLIIFFALTMAPL